MLLCQHIQVALSYFVTTVSYTRNFIRLAPYVILVKLSFFVSSAWQNKLECLLLVRFFRLVNYLHLRPELTLAEPITVPNAESS